MVKINVSDITPADRYNALVKVQTEKISGFMKNRGRCNVCALLNNFCVCDSLSQLALPEAELPLQVVVLMNQKEQYRSSNTAKVIEKVLSARVLIDGIEEDWAALQAMIAERKTGECFLLFPSEDSVDYATFASTAAHEGGSAVRGSSNVVKPLVILVDGTWRQARKLNQKISPAIPRIKILPQTLSRFLCRRQTRADRVCTIEALSLLLVDMGLVPLSEQLDKGLAVLLEGFNMQCFGSTHRPASMLKEKPNEKHLPPRHPDSLIEYDA